MACRERFFLWLAFIWVWSETIRSRAKDLVAKEYTTRNMNISEVGVILNYGEPSVIVALNAHRLGTNSIGMASCTDRKVGHNMPFTGLG